MKYKWAIYTQNEVLITRTITRLKAKAIAQQWKGIIKYEVMDSEAQKQYKDYYSNGGK